jgi:hypothetical protein
MEKLTVKDGGIHTATGHRMNIISEELVLKY